MNPEDLSKASTIPDMLDPETSESSPPKTFPASIPVQPAEPAPVPEPSVPIEPAPSLPINATEPVSLKQIRTYQGDIAAALHKEDASLVSIQIAEKAKQDLLKKNTSVPETEKEDEGGIQIKSIALFLGGLILIGAAGFAGWYSYTTYLKKTAVPIIVIPQNRFLPVASTENIDTTSLTKQALVSLIQSEKKNALTGGNLLHIELRKGALEDSPLLNTTEFLLLAEAKPPANLVRAFDPLFMLSVLGGTPESTVILIKIDSYENAFAGMLEWEKSLREDLLPFFTSEAGIASVPPGTAFSDITIKNKDARILVDESGKGALIYTFYNQNLLIITDNEASLRTMLQKLDTQALAR